MDQAAGLAHPHRRHPDVHERPAFPVVAQRWQRRVDLEDQFAASAGQRDIRVSSFDGTENQSSFQSERSRSVYVYLSLLIPLNISFIRLNAINTI